MASWAGSAGFLGRCFSIGRPLNLTKRDLCCTLWVSSDVHGKPDYLIKTSSYHSRNSVLANSSGVLYRTHSVLFFTNDNNYLQANRLSTGKAIPGGQVLSEDLCNL
jgi:hypothetical protein